ncbi:MAG: lamin tail domain-containing protein, partial [Calditrichales bacterium]|nr:lamin tail domain-containing protein [Calditrichales bacterium]
MRSKITFLTVVSFLLIVFSSAFSQQEANWGKDLDGYLMHEGDNEFDMLWNNFVSQDTIIDDVCGIAVTDAANDLDGDGLAEIICSDDDGYTYVFECLGSDSFNLVWSIRIGTEESNTFTPIVITDLNGNGYKEITAAYEDLDTVRIFEWDGIVGSDNYVEVANLVFPQDDIRTMTAGNLDSDANQEIVIAANDTCYVYEADASFNFKQEVKMPSVNAEDIYSVVIGDLNNNDTLEIIFGYKNNVNIDIWENTGEDAYVRVLPEGFELQFDVSETGRSQQLVITDVDGDGFDEIYSGDSNGKLIVFEMQSSSWSTDETNMKYVMLLDKSEDDINGITSGDGDEDGNPDIYFVSDDDHVWDWEYTGGDIFDPASYVEYDLGSFNGANAERIIYSTDIDGDGEKDMVVGYEGSSDFPLLYFLEHHVPPSVPSLVLNPDNIEFKTLWNINDVDTAVVEIQNIGTVELVIDSVVSSNEVFTSYLANNTIPPTGSDVMDVYFTALDLGKYHGMMVIFSNSVTSPDTLTLYGVARERPTLYINEFQPKGIEWIEIYNAGVDSVDLTDIGITDGVNTYNDDFGKPVWSRVEYFTENADWDSTQKLAPGEYLTSFTTAADLNNSQDWIYLVFRDSVVIDMVAYGAVGSAPVVYNFYGSDSITTGSVARVAYEDIMATDWTGDFDATPGWENDAPAPALGSSVIINEVDYDENVDGIYEYVEFYNPTGAAIVMNGWKFTDGDDIFTIDSITVPPMGVAVWEDSTNLVISPSDVACLYDNNGVRLDQMGFMTGNPTKTAALLGTMQRIPDGAGPNEGYDYLSSGGGETLFDLAPTMGSLNNMTYVIFTAKVGGESDYRTFWVNGSWDANGIYDDTWSGPMVELINNGVWPDTSATDSIFTGLVNLGAGTAYQWWVGSENDGGSWLENGAEVTPVLNGFTYSQTCVVDPG